METIWSLCVGALFACWLAGSVVNQFRLGSWRKVTAHDRFMLLPRWTFFAPNPGRTDPHLVFRDCRDCEPGPWREIGWAPPNRWLWWLWNPGRYPRKAVSDLAAAVMTGAAAATGSDARLATLSPAYIALLQCVMAQPGAVSGGLRQFALVHSRTFAAQRPLQVAFVSEWHRVEP